jgi:hypothetical protein
MLRRPRSESGLPQGTPASRGRPLDKAVPGYSTFNKPESDIRHPSSDDQPIYRVDSPDDVQKDRSSIDVNEDSSNQHDGLGYFGWGKNDNTNKTKYPYRDGIPNKKYAAVVRWLIDNYNRKRR